MTHRLHRHVRFIYGPHQGDRTALGYIFGLPVAISLSLFVVSEVGRPLTLIGGVAVLAVLVYTAILPDWRRSFRGLLVYLPFAGVVIIAFYPSRVPLLLKDFLFVIPAYLFFALSLLSGKESLRDVPRQPLLLMLALGALAVVQLANPRLPNLFMGLIGLKVWLFYLPLFALAFAYIRTGDDLAKLFRLLVVLTLIPTSIGIIEVLWISSFGYREIMLSIYGQAAAGATQNFTKLGMSARSSLVRVPSTFPFVTQYFGFTLAMIAPAYVLRRLDPSGRWRRLASLVLAIDILAAFLSGARAAFLFIPLELAVLLFIDRSSGSATFPLAALGLLAFAAASILGTTVLPLIGYVSGLTSRYASDTAYGALLDSILRWPLGAGTGINTGAARFAFENPNSFVAVENFYAKAVHELGIPGLLIVGGLFIWLVRAGLRIHGRLRDPRLRSCAAALEAFIIAMALNSFKGWQLDIDPVNVYFWVFAGILMRLPSLEPSYKDAREAVRQAAALRTSTRG